jgi:hypothetical protein
MEKYFHFHKSPDQFTCNFAHNSILRCMYSTLQILSSPTPWLLNPWSADFIMLHVTTFVNDVYTSLHNNFDGRVNHLLAFFHVWPAKQPAKTGVDFWQEIFELLYTT